MSYQNKIDQLSQYLRKKVNRIRKTSTENAIFLPIDKLLGEERRIMKALYKGKLSRKTTMVEELEGIVHEEN